MRQDPHAVETALSGHGEDPEGYANEQESIQRTS